MVVCSVLVPKVVLTMMMRTDTILYATCLYAVYAVYASAFAITLRFSQAIAELATTNPS